MNRPQPFNQGFAPGMPGQLGGPGMGGPGMGGPGMGGPGMGGPGMGGPPGGPGMGPARYNNPGPGGPMSPMPPSPNMPPTNGCFMPAATIRKISNTTPPQKFDPCFYN